jgi:hypothetical protein
MPRGAVKSLRGLGFHEMPDRFQLKYVQEQSDELLDHLDESIRLTEKAVPIRAGGFKLDRTDGGRPSGKREEAVWERAIWSQCGPSSDQGKGAFLPGVCLFVRSFQVPLKSRRADPWGKIDLLGVAPDFLPVVIELKRGGALDTPLRVLVEAAAYGVALRKLWNTPSSKFRLEWSRGLRSRFAGAEVPSRLGPLTLICAAPKEYWARCVGCRGNRGAVNPEGWRSIWKLVGAFQSKGFRVECAQLSCSSMAPDGIPRGVSSEVVTPWAAGREYSD